MKWWWPSALALLGCGSTVHLPGDGGPETGGAAPSTVGSGGASSSGGSSTAGEGGAGGAPPPPLPNPCEDGSCVRVFVSSERYPVDLGGLDGADAKCQALADAASMEGTFKAWLSDADVSAGERLVHHDLPYVLVDGTVVADGWESLAVPEPASRITLNEHGQQPATYDGITNDPGDEGPMVWTGTYFDGTAGQEPTFCGGPHWETFTMTIAKAHVAFVFPLDGLLGVPPKPPLETWSGNVISASSCAVEHHLYCFEQ